VLTDHYNPDFLNILTNVGYINSFTNKPYLSPVYWTLGIEFQFYILITLFYQLISKRYSPVLLLAVCICPLYINALRLSILSFFPLFAIGILYFLYKKEIVNRWQSLLYGGLISIISLYRLGIPETCTALYFIITGRCITVAVKILPARWLPLYRLCVC
jgi:peptidoglycan/LPS O-acetylase OafA/YrhL